jgi:hypothetical protein
MTERPAKPATSESRNERRRAPTVDDELLCSCAGCYSDWRRRFARAATH